jgi:hypothetical protein
MDNKTIILGSLLTVSVIVAIVYAMKNLKAAKELDLAKKALAAQVAANSAAQGGGIGAGVTGTV